MVEIVNVVASGALSVELDLDKLSRDIGDHLAKYDPNKYPGMYLRFGEDSPLVTIYRTGKYIITGSASKKEANSLRERFLNLFYEMGVIDEPEDEWFAV